MAIDEERLATLRAGGSKEGCALLAVMLQESRNGSEIYPYMRALLDMLDDANSFVRTRALLLIAANARWDRDYLIDESLEAILSHISDPRPITSRQFIAALPELAEAKPELREEIIRALHDARTESYASSMRPLVEKDIQNALREISSQREETP